MTDSNDAHDVHFRDQLEAAMKDAQSEALELKERLQGMEGARVTESHDGFKEGSKLDEVVEHWHWLTFKDPDREVVSCHHLKPSIGVFYGLLGMPAYLGCQECTIEMLNLTTRIGEIINGGIRCDCCREKYPIENHDNTIVNILFNSGPVNLFGLICKTCAADAGYKREVEGVS